MAKPTLTLTIEKLGGRGDGIASNGRDTVYVSGALPGEVVVVSVTEASRGDLREILSSSPSRIAPPCPSYGECGGCMAQHMAAPLYREWKSENLANALRHRGLGGAPLGPMACMAPGALRRARLAYRIAGKTVSLGYRARGSKRIVNVEHCLLLTPALGSLLGPTRLLLASLPGMGGQGEVAFTETDSGIDLRLQGGTSLDLGMRESLAEFASRHDLARLSYVQAGERAPETVSIIRTPVMRFGGISVALPEGAFIQPSAEGETHIRRHVLAATEGAARVADLYAGCGALSLPVAANGARVLAVEGDPAMAGSLRAAAGRAGRHLEVETRDLARRPLDAAALADFDAVILDPPRAGALNQMRQIALSEVATVISVSCNPATFARDARVLADGGYRVEAISPVDQFPFSSHLEVVGIFRR